MFVCCREGGEEREGGRAGQEREACLCVGEWLCAITDGVVLATWLGI